MNDDEFKSLMKSEFKNHLKFWVFVLAVGFGAFMLTFGVIHIPFFVNSFLGVD